MLTSDYDKYICEKYSKKDEQGYVHCDKCPLLIDGYELMCKANAHYDKKRKEWMFDDE